jgi:hypothetical protein
VLDWFKAQGGGYQNQINALLRAYMEAHQSWGDRSVSFSIASDRLFNRFPLQLRYFHNSF